MALVNLLLIQEYTHDPSFLPQINLLSYNLQHAAQDDTDTCTFNTSTNQITSNQNHVNWLTGKRVNFTTTGSLPKPVPNWY